jgi:hypothetical protein
MAAIEKRASTTRKKPRRIQTRWSAFLHLFSTALHLFSTTGIDTGITTIVSPVSALPTGIMRGREKKEENREDPSIQSGWPRSGHGGILYIERI